MATSGSFVFIPEYTYSKWTFSWERTSYTEGNSPTSTISWTLSAVQNGKRPTPIAPLNLPYSLHIDGVEVESDTVVSYPNIDNILSTSGTYTIAHNSDGTKTFTVALSVTADRSHSQSYVLPTIPVPATITYAPNFTDDDNPTISFSNPSGTALDNLEACISLTGGRDDIPYRTILKSASSYTFNLTEAERETLRNAIGEDRTATVRFYVRSTIDGVQYWSYLDRTVRIVGNEPSISAVIVDTDSRSTQVTGDPSQFILGVSDAHYTLTVEGKKGATITSYHFINGGVEYYDTLEGTIYNITDNRFYLSVTDSRGVVSGRTITVPTIPYTKLSATIAVGSVNPNGTLSITISGSYYNGSFGAKDNTLELEYSIDDGGNITKTIIGDATPTFLSDDRYTLTYTIRGLDPEKTYLVQARAIDEITNSSSLWVSTSKTPVFDWGLEDFRHNTTVKLTKNKPLQVNDGGTLKEVLNPLNSSGHIRLGYGNYSAADGDTNIYGNNVNIKSKEDVTINNVPFGGRVLWQGALHMNGSQTISLSSNVSEQINGIVLVFSGFDNTNGFPLDSSYNTFFISKKEVELLPGKAHSFFLLNNAGFSKIGAKYLIINDDSIKGYNNTNSGSGSNNGFSYTNHYFALRYVIGV